MNNHLFLKNLFGFRDDISITQFYSSSKNHPWYSPNTFLEYIQSSITQSLVVKF